MSIVLDPSLIIIVLRGKNLLIWVQRNGNMIIILSLQEVCVMCN